MEDLDYGAASTVAEVALTQQTLDRLRSLTSRLLRLTVFIQQDSIMLNALQTFVIPQSALTALLGQPARLASSCHHLLSSPAFVVGQCDMRHTEKCC